MIQVGLIGDIQLLDPYVSKAMEHPEIVITGKSSVGIPPKPGSTRIQAPEFNRIELIERSDALMINKFSLLPFQLVCDIVKKSKHIFAASYPELSVGECMQLAKLANEAKTVIQFVNPNYYLPPVQWLNKTSRKQSFTTISSWGSESREKDSLMKMLLMLKDLLGAGPKKVNAVAFQSPTAGADFNHVSLERGDGSVIQLNFGKTPGTSEFLIKSYSTNQFAQLDVVHNIFTSNGEPLDLTEHSNKNETHDFIKAVFQNKKAATGIEDYSMALQTKQAILDKLNRYINC